MNITYIANARIPTEKAHGLQIMKMCEAFSQLGHKVILIAPWRANLIKESPFEYYQANRSFEIKKLFCFDFVFLHKISGKITYFIRTTIFGLSLLFNEKIRRAEIIYTRDIFSVFLLALFKRNIFYEMHYLVRGKKFFYRLFLKLVRGIITINQWEKKELMEKWKIEPNKIFTSPSGVDLGDFKKLPTQQATREKYQIPPEKIVFGYIGRFKTLGMDKGLNLVLEAFKEAWSRNKNIYLVLAGGSQSEIKLYQKKIEDLRLKNNVKLLPYVAYNQVEGYYAIPDIFLLPYPKNLHFDYYMSPMKLMEYVASQKPVICSYLNSIRELFNEDELCFVEPNEVNQLKDKMLELAKSAAKREALASKAFVKIKNKDWDSRATQIIQFIKSRVNAD